MAENKTKSSDQPVDQFLNSLEDEQKRKDSFTLLALFQQVTGMEPVMWGGSIIGFGRYHYRYESGREGDSHLVGFSPRKQNLTLYNNVCGFGMYDSLLEKLGKHDTGKGCLYIKRLDDINLSVLKALLEKAFEHSRQKHLA